MSEESRRESFAISQLHDVFNVLSPRPMQETLIRRVVGGSSLLAVLPTGWGKSTLYQVPAIARAGVAIVVSPLISLMEDQVEGLRAKGIAAGSLNSRTTAGEYSQVMDSLAQGALKLLYISPKRLESGWIEELSFASRVSLIAIDEAHLIVDWGLSGFNKSYLNAYRGLRRRFPDAPIVATTGSSTAATAYAIREAMGFRPEDIGKSLQYYRVAPDRPEIRLDVINSSSTSRITDIVNKVKEMVQLHWGTESQRSTGIVYTLTPRDAERLSQRLTSQLGIEVPFYHAKIEDEGEREQSIFEDLRSKLERKVVPAIVSTSAAGMGIDIRGLRWAVHDGMRTSIEEYWQQVGRIGRDQSALTPGSCIATLITGGDGDQKRWDLIQRWSASRTNTSELFRRREHLAYAYGDTTLCRKGFLAGYLGDGPGPDCGYCDNCIEERSGAMLDGEYEVKLAFIKSAAADAGYKYSVEQLQSHPDYGIGLNIDRVGEAIKMLFLDGNNEVFTKFINPSRLNPIAITSAGESRHTHSQPVTQSTIRPGWTVCVNKQIDALIVSTNDVYFDVMIDGALRSVPSAICWGIDDEPNYLNAMKQLELDSGTGHSSANRSAKKDNAQTGERVVSARPISDDWRNDR